MQSMTITYATYYQSRAPWSSSCYKGNRPSRQEQLYRLVQ